jgi:uncharacterized protein
MRAHELTVLPGRIAVCRRDPADGVPAWFDPSPPLASLVRTEQELTLVAPEERVPDEVEAEGGWRALRVEGEFDLTTTFGVIAGVTNPLAAAEVSVLSISSYATDYLLVQEPDLDRATQALRDAGHGVAEAPG